MEVKDIWTNKDFSEMGWHDSQLYQLKFSDEDCNFILYLDYIFKWEEQDDGFFKFWVSPCEMTFHNVIDADINISFKKSIGVDIIDIKRKKIGLTPNGKMIDWEFEIETDKGYIKLIATDFNMKVISQPIFSRSQSMNS